MSPKNSPMVCDGYVKYEEAKVDRSAIMQDFRKQITAVAVATDCEKYNKQPVWRGEGREPLN